MCERVGSTAIDSLTHTTEEFLRISVTSCIHGCIAMETCMDVYHGDIHGCIVALVTETGRVINLWCACAVRVNVVVWCVCVYICICL